jgi:hypothetical protein
MVEDATDETVINGGQGVDAAAKNRIAAGPRYLPLIIVRAFINCPMPVIPRNPPQTN